MYSPISTIYFHQKVLKKLLSVLPPFMLLALETNLPCKERLNIRFQRFLNTSANPLSIAMDDEPLHGDEKPMDSQEQTETILTMHASLDSIINYTTPSSALS